jgi:hypothetical protein
MTQENGLGEYGIEKQRIAGAALIDQSFREALEADPEEAIRSLDLGLPDDAVRLIAQQVRDVDWEAVRALEPLVGATMPRAVQGVAAWG